MTVQTVPLGRSRRAIPVRPARVARGSAQVPGAVVAGLIAVSAWAVAYIVRQLLFPAGRAPSFVGDFAIEGALLGLVALAGIIALAAVAATAVRDEPSPARGELPGR